MKISISNNHIVVPVNTVSGPKKAVLDTGAGATFFTKNGIDSGEVDGVTFQVIGSPFLGFILPNDLDELVGMHVDGFLGPSFLKASDIAIDMSAEDLHMEAECPEGASQIHIGDFMGLPIFDMEFNGNKVRAAFDTGNRYPFLKMGLVERFGLEDTGEMIEDYNPMFGRFTAKVYKGDITIGGKTFRDCQITACKEYDQAASLIGVDAFMGIEPLKESVIWFSYQNSLMAIK